MTQAAGRKDRPISVAQGDLGRLPTWVPPPPPLLGPGRVCGQFRQGILQAGVPGLPPAGRPLQASKGTLRNQGCPLACAGARGCCQALEGPGSRVREARCLPEAQAPGQR